MTDIRDFAQDDKPKEEKPIFLEDQPLEEVIGGEEIETTLIKTETKEQKPLIEEKDRVEVQQDPITRPDNKKDRTRPMMSLLGELPLVTAGDDPRFDTPWNEAVNVDKQDKDKPFWKTTRFKSGFDILGDTFEFFGRNNVTTAAIKALTGWDFIKAENPALKGYKGSMEHFSYVRQQEAKLKSQYEDITDDFIQTLYDSESPEEVDARVGELKDKFNLFTRQNLFFRTDQTPEWAEKGAGFVTNFGAGYVTDPINYLGFGAASWATNRIASTGFAGLNGLSFGSRLGRTALQSSLTGAESAAFMGLWSEYADPARQDPNYGHAFLFGAGLGGVTRAASEGIQSFKISSATKKHLKKMNQRREEILGMNDISKPRAVSPEEFNAAQTESLSEMFLTAPDDELYLMIAKQLEEQGVITGSMSTAERNAQIIPRIEQGKMLAQQFKQFHAAQKQKAEEYDFRNENLSLVEDSGLDVVAAQKRVEAVRASQEKVRASMEPMPRPQSLVSPEDAQAALQLSPEGLSKLVQNGLLHEVGERFALGEIKRLQAEREAAKATTGSDDVETLITEAGREVVTPFRGLRAEKLTPEQIRERLAVRQKIGREDVVSWSDVPAYLGIDQYQFEFLNHYFKPTKTTFSLPAEGKEMGDRFLKRQTLDFYDRFLRTTDLPFNHQMTRSDFARVLQITIDDVDELIAGGLIDEFMYKEEFIESANTLDIRRNEQGEMIAFKVDDPAVETYFVHNFSSEFNKKFNEEMVQAIESEFDYEKLIKDIVKAEKDKAGEVFDPQETQNVVGVFNLLNDYAAEFATMFYDQIITMSPEGKVIVQDRADEMARDFLTAYLNSDIRDAKEFTRLWLWMQYSMTKRHLALKPAEAQMASEQRGFDTTIPKRQKGQDFTFANLSPQGRGDWFDRNANMNPEFRSFMVTWAAAERQNHPELWESFLKITSDLHLMRSKSAEFLSGEAKDKHLTGIEKYGNLNPDVLAMIPDVFFDEFVYRVRRNEIKFREKDFKLIDTLNTQLATEEIMTTVLGDREDIWPRYDVKTGSWQEAPEGGWPDQLRDEKEFLKRGGLDKEYVGGDKPISLRFVKGLYDLGIDLTRMEDLRKIYTGYFVRPTRETTKYQDLIDTVPDWFDPLNEDIPIKLSLTDVLNYNQSRKRVRDGNIVADEGSDIVSTYGQRNETRGLEDLPEDFGIIEFPKVDEMTARQQIAALFNVADRLKVMGKDNKFIDNFMMTNENVEAIVQTLKLYGSLDQLFIDIDLIAGDYVPKRQKIDIIRQMAIHRRPLDETMTAMQRTTARANKEFYRDSDERKEGAWRGFNQQSNFDGAHLTRTQWDTIEKDLKELFEQQSGLLSKRKDVAQLLPLAKGKKNKFVGSVFAAFIEEATATHQTISPYFSQLIRKLYPEIGDFVDTNAAKLKLPQDMRDMMIQAEFIDRLYFGSLTNEKGMYGPETKFRTDITLKDTLKMLDMIESLGEYRRKVDQSFGRLQFVDDKFKRLIMRMERADQVSLQDIEALANAINFDISDRYALSSFLSLINNARQQFLFREFVSPAVWDKNKMDFVADPNKLPKVMFPTKQDQELFGRPADERIQAEEGAWHLGGTLAFAGGGAPGFNVLEALSDTEQAVFFNGREITRSQRRVLRQLAELDAKQFDGIAFSEAREMMNKQIDDTKAMLDGLYKKKAMIQELVSREHRIRTELVNIQERQNQRVMDGVERDVIASDTKKLQHPLHKMLKEVESVKNEVYPLGVANLHTQILLGEITLAQVERRLGELGKGDITKLQHGPNLFAGRPMEWMQKALHQVKKGIDTRSRMSIDEILQQQKDIALEKVFQHFDKQMKQDSALRAEDLTRGLKRAGVHMEISPRDVEMYEGIMKAKFPDNVGAKPPTWGGLALDDLANPLNKLRVFKRQSLDEFYFKFADVVETLSQGRFLTKIDELTGISVGKYKDGTLKDLIYRADLQFQTLVKEENARIGREARDILNVKALQEADSSRKGIALAKIMDAERPVAFQYAKFRAELFDLLTAREIPNPFRNLQRMLIEGSNVPPLPISVIERQFGYVQGSLGGSEQMNAFLPIPKVDLIYLAEELGLAKGLATRGADIKALPKAVVRRIEEIGEKFKITGAADPQANLEKALRDLGGVNPKTGLPQKLHDAIFMFDQTPEYKEIIDSATEIIGAYIAPRLRPDASIRHSRGRIQHFTQMRKFQEAEIKKLEEYDAVGNKFIIDEIREGVERNNTMIEFYKDKLAYARELKRTKEDGYFLELQNQLLDFNPENMGTLLKEVADEAIPAGESLVEKFVERAVRPIERFVERGTISAEEAKLLQTLREKYDGQLTGEEIDELFGINDAKRALNRFATLRGEMEPYPAFSVNPFRHEVIDAVDVGNEEQFIGGAIRARAQALRDHLNDITKGLKPGEIPVGYPDYYDVRVHARMLKLEKAVQTYTAPDSVLRTLVTTPMVQLQQVQQIRREWEDLDGVYHYAGEPDRLLEGMEEAIQIERDVLTRNYEFVSTIEQQMDRIGFGRTRDTGFKRPKGRRRPPSSGEAGFTVNIIPEILGLLFKGTGKLYEAITRALTSIGIGRRVVDTTAPASGRKDALSFFSELGADQTNLVTAPRAPKVLNGLRTRRGRTQANSSGLIRILGQMAYGSERFRIDGDDIIYAGSNSQRQVLREGAVKYKMRKLAYAATKKNKLEDELSRLESQLKRDDLMEIINNDVYPTIYTQARLERMQGKDPRTVDPAELLLEDVNPEISNQVVLDVLTAKGLSPDQALEVAKFVTKYENTKRDIQKQLGDIGEEFDIYLDPTSGARILDWSSFRDLNQIVKDGALEQVMSDALIIENALTGVTRETEQVLGHAIMEKLASGDIAGIHDLGSFTRPKLQNLLKDINAPRLQQLYGITGTREEIIGRVLDNLADKTPARLAVRTQRINELRVEKMRIEEDLKQINIDLADPSLLPNIRQQLEADKQQLILDRRAVDAEIDTQQRKEAAFDPNDYVRIKIDLDKQHTLTLDNKPDLQYSLERLRNSRLGRYIGQGVVDGFSLKDIGSSNIFDDLEILSGHMTDARIKKDVVDEFNELMKNEGVIGADGLELQFTDANEMFQQIEALSDQMFKNGVIDDSKEFNRMLAMLKQDITGQRSTREEFGRFVRLMQKGATATSTAGFSVPALFELIEPLTRNLDEVFSQIPMAREMLSRPKNLSQEATIDLMRMAGVGTEGALYRNSGSHRRSVIFDRKNPMVKSTVEKPQIGNMNVTDKVVNSIEEGMDKFTDKAGIPLNAVTHYGQSMVYNAMISRIFDGIKKGKDILSPEVVAQMGWTQQEWSDMQAAIKNVLGQSGMLSKRRGINLWNIGDIMNHPSIPFSMRDRLAAGLYNWIGKQIVRPDLGDMPAYMDTKVLQLVTQFRSFGMAVFGKKISPLTQRAFFGRDRKGATGATAALSVILLLQGIYSMLNYVMYNEEGADDVAAMLDGRVDISDLDTYLGEGLDSNIHKAFLGGVIDPIKSPVGLVLDPTLHYFLGVPDPTEWYDSRAGTPYEVGEDLARQSAAFRFAVNTFSPLHNAVKGAFGNERALEKLDDPEYWTDWGARMGGIHKFYKIYGAMSDN